MKDVVKIGAFAGDKKSMRSTSFACTILAITFAIPLATLVKAIYVAWPRQSDAAFDDHTVL